MRKRVSIAVQVILCFIPLVWIWGFFRIEKLIAGILMLIGVTILVIVIFLIAGSVMMQSMSEISESTSIFDDIKEWGSFEKDFNP